MGLFGSWRYGAVRDSSDENFSRKTEENEQNLAFMHQFRDKIISLTLAI